MFIHWHLQHCGLLNGWCSWSGSESIWWGKKWFCPSHEMLALPGECITYKKNFANSCLQLKDSFWTSTLAWHYVIWTVDLCCCLSTGLSNLFSLQVSWKWKLSCCFGQICESLAGFLSEWNIAIRFYWTIL